MSMKVNGYPGLYISKTGIYGFRMATPKALLERRKREGQKCPREIKQSFNTKDIGVAKDMYYSLKRELNAEVQLSVTPKTMSPYPTESFRDDVLKKTAYYFQQYGGVVQEKFSKQMLKNEHNQLASAELRNNIIGYVKSKIKQFSSELEANIFSDTSRLFLSNFLAGRYSLAPEQEEFALKSFVSGALEGMLFYQDTKINFVHTEDNYPFRYPIVEEAVKKYRDSKENKVLEKIGKSKNTTTIQGIFEQWSKEGGDVAERLSAVESFIKCFPEKKDLDEVNSLDISNWLKILEKLPAGYLRINRLKDKSISELLEIAENEKLPGLKKVTINKYLTAFSAFYKWAKKNGLIKGTYGNPTSELSFSKKEVKTETRGREALTLEEARLVIDHYNNNYKLQNPDYYWASMLMLYNGLRQKEACQLEISDIRKKNNIWYISVQENRSEINSVKNKNSIRNIPIHKQLITWGFIDFVEERRKIMTGTNKQLFTNLKAYKKGNRYSYSKDFSAEFRKILKNLNIDRETVCAYSMRHTFIDALRRAGYVDNEIARMDGHSNQNAMTAHYGDFHDATDRFLEVIKTMVDSAEY